ncbi:hypothetical protein HYS28_03750 [Candidatus Uhrbacteria bacterium]|nr:hypothetical protein [Candidatus Uhrbacteria bacterium]
MLALTFPLWYLLVPFGVVVLGSTLFMFFNLYHVAKFGIQSVQTTMLLIVYLLSYLVALAVAVALVGSYEWSAEVLFLDIFPFTGSSPSSFGL